MTVFSFNLGAAARMSDDERDELLELLAEMQAVLPLAELRFAIECVSYVDRRRAN
jgi:hypothetical protein